MSTSQPVDVDGRLCPWCGTRVAEAASACPSCKTTLVAIPLRHQWRPTSLVQLAVLILCAVAVIRLLSGLWVAVDLGSEVPLSVGTVVRVQEVAEAAVQAALLVAAAAALRLAERYIEIRGRQSD